MTCREFAELLYDLVAGELSAEDHERVQQHFVKCPPCVAFAESYRLLISLSRQLPCDEVPVHVEQRVRAFLETNCKDLLSK